MEPELHVDVQLVQDVMFKVIIKVKDNGRMWFYS